MKLKNIKIVGLLVLIVLFTLSMTACDNNSDQLSDISKEGELIVTANNESVVQYFQSLNDSTNDMQLQNTIANRYKNFKLKIKLSHTHENAEYEKTSVLFETIDGETKPTFSLDFGKIGIGEWKITATVIADYYNNSSEALVEDVEVAIGTSTTVVSVGDSQVSSVDLITQTGDFKLNIEQPNNIEYGEVILSDGSSVSNVFDETPKSFTFTGINANHYTFDIDLYDSEGGNLIYGQDDGYWDNISIMVLPGLTAEANIKVIDNTSGEIIWSIASGNNVNWNDMGPNAPDISLDGDKIVWSPVVNADSYTVLRRDLNLGMDNFREISSTNDSEYPLNISADKVFEYAVIAKRKIDEETFKASDYSNILQVEGSSSRYVTNSTELQNAINNPDINNIVLGNDISIENTINVNEDVTIYGNGYTISPNSSAVHAMTIYSSATIKNLTVDNENIMKGVQAYVASGKVKLENITILDSVGAALTVNGSDVEAHNLNTSGSEWGSVNIDKGGGVTEDPSFKLTGDNNLSEDLQIWSELGRFDIVEAEGFHSYLFDKDENNTGWTGWTDSLENKILNEDSRYLFESIQTAVNEANVGDVILVGSGTYNEEVTIDVESLTLKGINRDSTIINQGIYVRNNDVTVENLTAQYIEFHDFDNIIIRNNITTGNKSTVGIGAVGGINNGPVTITNNLLKTGVIGLYPIKTLDNYDIDNNTIESAPAEGIWLSYSNTDLDLDATVIDNYLDDLLLNNTIEDYDTYDIGAKKVKILDEDKVEHSKSTID